MEGHAYPPPRAASEFARKPPAAAPGGSPAAADEAAEPDAFAERPELYVGAAFAGGLVLAGVLRLLGR